MGDVRLGAARCAVVLSLVSLLGGVGCGSVLKPPEPDRTLRLTTKADVFAGNNGFVFVVLPDASSRVVRVDARYPVGSAHDPVGKEGLAHLVEHLLFEVEVDRPTGKTSIAAELGQLTHFWNAETGTDYTHYVSQGVPESLGGLLRLEAERLSVGCAGITAETFAREKEVVLNELRERQGPSGAAFAKVLLGALYPEGHPYRLTDSVESVSKLELADVCAFLADQYQRGRASVVVSGRVSPDQVRQAVIQHFAQLPPRRVDAVVAAPPVSPRPGTVRVRADVEEAELLAVWPLPAMSTPEYRLLQLARGPISGRLSAFALTYGWGHSASTSIVGGQYAPQLMVSVTLRSKDEVDEAVDALEKTMEYTFRSLYKNGEEQDSPRWVRRHYNRAATLIGRYESLGGRARMLSDYIHGRMGLRLIEQLRELDATTPEIARNVAERWLDPERARYVVVEPEPQATGRVRSASSFVAGDSEVHGVSVDPAQADEPLPIPADAGLALETIRYETETGLDVILWPHGQLPMVHARLVIDSGTAQEPAGLEGLALFQGADEAYDDHLVYSDWDVSIRVDEVIRGLSSELRWPGYDLSDEFEDHLRSRLRMSRAAERRRYSLDFLAAVYGAEHPYARAPMTERSLDEIGSDRIKSWGREHVVPANATFILAGSFDPELVKQHVAYNTDHVGSGDESSREVPLPKRGAAYVSGQSRPERPTVSIDIGFAGGVGLDRHYGARLVVAGILSSKLSELRLDRALSYGFSASYEPRRGGGLWHLGGEVDAARAAEAARALQRILAELRADPESFRSEFVLARRKVVEQLLSRSSDSGAMAERLALMARFDLPDDFFERLVADIAALTLDDAHALVRSELSAQAQVFGAFGPEASVAAALAAAREPVTLEAREKPAAAPEPGAAPEPAASEAGQGAPK